MSLYDASGKLISAETTQNRDTNATNQLASVTQAVSSAPPTQPQVQPTSTTAAYASTPKRDWHQWIISGGTLILAITALVGIGFNAYQLRLTLNALKSSDDSSIKILDQMRHQNESAKQQLELTDRAWVKVSLTPSNPVTHTADIGQFGVALIMKNVGHSVANRCVVKHKFIVAWNSYFTEPTKQQISLCGTPPNSIIKDSDKGPLTFTVFPDDYEITGIGDNIPIASIKKEGVYRGGMSKGQFLGYTVMIIGCVDYEYGTSKHHQTGFIYEMTRLEPEQPTLPYLIHLGETLPREKVRLQKWIFGGSYAY